MTQASDLQEVSQLFKTWDINSDGYLQFEEIEQKMGELTEMLQMNEDDLRRTLRNADANKDGKLDYSEFVTAAFDKTKLVNRQNLEKVFKMIDTNNDKKISKEELQSVFGASQMADGEATWQDIMSEVDTDGDGSISYDEFYDHMCKIIRRRSDPAHK